MAEESQSRGQFGGTFQGSFGELRDFLESLIKNPNLLQVKVEFSYNPPQVSADTREICKFLGCSGRELQIEAELDRLRSLATTEDRRIEAIKLLREVAEVGLIDEGLYTQAEAEIELGYQKWGVEPDLVRCHTLNGLYSSEAEEMMEPERPYR